MPAKLGYACFIALFLSFISPSPAQAYLDMGTGSMLLQYMVAGLIGVAAFFRLFWSRLKDFFSSSKRRAKPDNEDTENA